MKASQNGSGSQCSTASGEKRSQRAFRWKITLLCLLTLPMLIGLGVWQLERAKEKQHRQARMDSVAAQPPAELPGTEWQALEVNRRVLLEGHYWPDRNWLLDNRQRQGRVGYEVVTPFELTDGTVVLVNRGWIAAARHRDEHPNPPVPSGEVTLFAQWLAPSDHPLLSGRPASRGWPAVALTLDPHAMGERLGESVPNFYARLDDGSPGVLITGWQDLEVSAARHFGYAVQWFTMALAVVFWGLWANRWLWRPRSTTTHSADRGSESNDND